MIYTSLDGQKDLPRYFSSFFGMFRDKIVAGQVDFILPDGRRFRLEGAEPGEICELQILNEHMFSNIVREGELGLATTYIEGDCSTPDLQSLLDFFLDRRNDFRSDMDGQWVFRLFERLRFWFKRNTKTQASQNISAHYDLGNDFYRLWLDDTMTYSSAIYETGQESLENAQTAKYKSIVDRLGVKPGDHVLEIGCGWGGFAEYAAKERGLKVTGLTISKAQLAYAQERMQKAGLSDAVSLKLQDYRDETGQYDGIASIEMFEAVGRQYWPVYFQTIRKCLKQGCAATLQVITRDHAQWESYSTSVDYIQKYIFPGGMLPSPVILREEIQKQGLSVTGSVEFAQSYSLTLRQWHKAFNDNWEAARAMGFDDRFRRMWNLYLTSCASGFANGHCDVTQINIAHPQ